MYPQSQRHPWQEMRRLQTQMEHLFAGLSPALRSPMTMTGEYPPINLTRKDDGIVLEAPTSSIFWVSPEGGLRTPAISSGILESITRAQIVRSLHVEEGDFTVEDLLGTREAFLASTVREVQPVAAIDGRELETPGPRTTEAAETFSRSLISSSVRTG